MATPWDGYDNHSMGGLIAKGHPPRGMATTTEQVQGCLVMATPETEWLR
jgi:hypothetical protein